MKNQREKKKSFKTKYSIKYTAFVAASIDGRIAQSGRSGTDWTSKEDWKFFQESLKKFDGFIVGHNTYLVARKHLKRRNTIVLTSKVIHSRSEGSVVFLNPERVDLNKFIKNNGFKKVAVLGGSKVYNFCLQRRMLDELFVTIEPYIFTSGVPMFMGKDFKKYKFSLISVKKINKSGTILLKYKNAN